ncbi:MAG: glycoside hydrolase family 32 protein, partial [Verrucomicrobia bacterium]|nr:glycoside hydrolase family 32 protein [Verrucomicrobiota bacterium]
MSANLIAGPYTERYRPQCHFSPREGWIGDPDGCIRYRNLYHLFWWGHAVSEDLVHWNELPWPMKGDDGSFDYYTGSVVVDERNTSGFGAETNSAMVAVYTAHERKGGRQTQRISYSTDYRNFHYYRKNPVLDIGSRSFRDPDVFWHESTEKWVMVVALPDQHTFRFFCSDNLREWRPLSDFGQIGSRDGLWEVPHLFEMQVEGEEGKTKWVLLCSVSPNRVQYFVGDFDGRKFTLDPAMAAELEPGPVPSGQVLFDFEATADGWKRTGSAFGARPVRGSLPKQQKVFGIEGRGYSSSYHGGDRATGTLTSPSFPITRDFINFKVAGGRGDDEMSVNLVVDGETVRSASGRNSETLLWRSWDVADLKGTQAQIRLVDRGTDDWGHIMADHFMISDAPVSSQRRDAFWLDYGPDFFAPRTFRNYDEEKMPVTLIGWMGNWEYANAVPTSWGR